MGFAGGLLVKNPPAMQETLNRSLGQGYLSGKSHGTCWATTMGSQESDTT